MFLLFCKEIWFFYFPVFNFTDFYSLFYPLGYILISALYITLFFKKLFTLIYINFLYFMNF